MKKLGKIILGTIRTIVAPLITILLIALVTAIPLWLFDWAITPLDLSSVSILQVTLIVIGVLIALSCIPYWLMSLCIFPGMLHRVITPPIHWLRITTASLTALIIIGLQILTIIAYKIGLVVISDGITTTTAPLPIGLTIYQCITTIPAAIGLIITSIIED